MGHRGELDSSRERYTAVVSQERLLEAMSKEEHGWFPTTTDYRTFEKKCYKACCTVYTLFL